jgi:hypothetical protein
VKTILTFSDGSGFERIWSDESPQQALENTLIEAGKQHEPVSDVVLIQIFEAGLVNQHTFLTIKRNPYSI